MTIYVQEEEIFSSEALRKGGILESACFGKLTLFRERAPKSLNP